MRSLSDSLKLPFIVFALFSGVLLLSLLYAFGRQAINVALQNRHLAHLQSVEKITAQAELFTESDLKQLQKLATGLSYEDLEKIQTDPQYSRTLTEDFLHPVDRIDRDDTRAGFLVFQFGETEYKRNRDRLRNLFSSEKKLKYLEWGGNDDRKNSRPAREIAESGVQIHFDDETRSLWFEESDVRKLDVIDGVNDFRLRIKNDDRFSSAFSIEVRSFTWGKIGTEKDRLQDANFIKELVDIDPKLGESLKRMGLMIPLVAKLLRKENRIAPKGSASGDHVELVIGSSFNESNRTLSINDIYLQFDFYPKDMVSTVEGKTRYYAFPAKIVSAWVKRNYLTRRNLQRALKAQQESLSFLFLDESTSKIISSYWDSAKQKLIELELPEDWRRQTIFEESRTGYFLSSLGGSGLSLISMRPLKENQMIFVTEPIWEVLKNPLLYLLGFITLLIVQGLCLRFVVSGFLRRVRSDLVMCAESISKNLNSSSYEANIFELGDLQSGIHDFNTQIAKRVQFFETSKTLMETLNQPRLSREEYVIQAKSAIELGLNLRVLEVESGEYTFEGQDLLDSEVIALRSLMETVEHHGELEQRLKRADQLQADLEIARNIESILSTNKVSLISESFLFEILEDNGTSIQGANVESCGSVTYFYFFQLNSGSTQQNALTALAMKAILDGLILDNTDVGQVAKRFEALCTQYLQNAQKLTVYYGSYGVDSEEFQIYGYPEANLFTDSKLTTERESQYLMRFKPTLEFVAEFGTSETPKPLIRVRSSS